MPKAGKRLTVTPPATQIQGSRSKTDLTPNAAGRMRAAVDHALANGGADGPVLAQEGGQH
jgi:hypothetical protein